MRQSIHTHRYRYRYLDYLGRAGRGVEGRHVEALAGVGMDGRRVVLVAVDDGGKQGALSAVLSIVPEPAVGAAALAGEQGGCTGLNSTGTNRLVMSAVPFMLIGLIHRRKKNAC